MSSAQATVDDAAVTARVKVETEVRRSTCSTYTGSGGVQHMCAHHYIYNICAPTSISHAFFKKERNTRVEWPERARAHFPGSAVLAGAYKYAAVSVVPWTVQC